MKYINAADACLFVTLAVLVVGACWANCGCGGNPFIAFDDDGGSVEDVTPDSGNDVVVDAADTGIDAVDEASNNEGGDADDASDAGDAGDGCAMPGLWCMWGGGGDFTPCGGGVNFTCSGASCDVAHCAEGSVCRIPNGMGPDGSLYTDGVVVGCAP